MKNNCLALCARLRNQLANRKGMEMLQVVLIIAMVVVLGALLFGAIRPWFGAYTTGLTAKLNTFTS